MRCRAENPADSNLSAPQRSDSGVLSVFNFTSSSSQDSGSSTPPRVRRGAEQKKTMTGRKKRKRVVRKQIRGTRIPSKEKKMRLEAVNQQWGLGKDDPVEDSVKQNEARCGKRVSFQCPSAEEDQQEVLQCEKRVLRRSILKDGTEKTPDQALSELQPPRSSPKRSEPRGGSPQSTPKHPRQDRSPGQRVRRRTRSGPSSETSSIFEKSVEERKGKESSGSSPATGRSQASPAYMKRNHKGETPLHLAAIKVCVFIGFV